MKRIGRVSHLSNSGKLVLRTKHEERVGVKVLNDELKTVGMIVDVFGPVDHPYISVRPVIHDPETYVGKFLYVLEKS